MPYSNMLKNWCCMYVDRAWLCIIKTLLHAKLYLVKEDHRINHKTESAERYKMLFFVSIIDILTQRERQERVHKIFLFYFTVYIHYAYCQFWLHNKQSQLLCLPKLFYLVIIMVHNTQKLVFSLYREQNNLRVAAILWCILPSKVLRYCNCKPYFH